MRTESWESLGLTLDKAGEHNKNRRWLSGSMGVDAAKPDPVGLLSRGPYRSPESWFRHAMRASTALAGMAAAGLWPVFVQGQEQNQGPRGGIVRAGDARIAEGAQKTVIAQPTRSAVIDWRQGFDVGRDHSVRFESPHGALSRTLNRVMTGTGSRIAGEVVHPGNFVLVNQNGIWITPTGRIDVGGFIGTTADINNDDFMAGRMNFSRASLNRSASVVNQGTISVAHHSLAALIAPGVVNEGLIEARLGKVVLGGSETFVIDPDGGGRTGFALTGAARARALGPNGEVLDEIVLNRGTITSGQVLISARALEGVVENAINLDGVVEASQARIDSDGDVILEAEGGGLVLRGKVEASRAIRASSEGGVTLDDARLTAGQTIDLASATDLTAQDGTLKADTLLLAADHDLTLKGTHLKGRDIEVRADADGSWHQGADSGSGGTAWLDDALLDVAGEAEGRLARRSVGGGQGVSCQGISRGISPGVGRADWSGRDNTH